MTRARGAGLPVRGRAALGGLLIALALAVAPPSTGAVVWLAGVDPFVRARMPGAGEGDFPALFEPDAPWKRASHTVAVFKVSTQYLLNGSDDELGRMIAGLHQLGIPLAFEALMIPRRGACGRVEGYSDPGAIARAAQRVKRLGGTLAYAAMDEPLWFGHFDKSPAACQSAIDTLVKGVAENVKALREIFPDVRIGDIEPLQGVGANTLKPADIMDFAEAYRRATGTLLAFVHADLDWERHADVELKELKRDLHGAGIKFGVIFDGDPDDSTDVAWTRRAQARFEDIEQEAGEAPDDAVLQTWMIRPMRMLPESQPGTMTHLVLLYDRRPTQLNLVRQGPVVVGRLVEAGGEPVAGAPIALWLAEDSPRIVSQRRLDGVVPAGAVHALVGLRANTEASGVGEGRIAIGLARYQETISPPIERRLLGDGDAKELAIQRGQPVSRGTSPFAVMAGRPFSFEVPMGADAGLEDAGYVALIFLGADGKEIKRFRLPLTPGRAALQPARTDADGRFRLEVTSAPGEGVVGGEFAGDEQRRGATATARSLPFRSLTRSGS